MRFRLLLPILLMFATINITSAQDDALAPWSIVERCLPTPTLTDDDWSYEGEIMLRGWAGIHGIRDGFDKPYVVHWGDGILSPNGKWVLSQKRKSYAETTEGGLGIYITDYGTITVQNLVTGERIDFPWEAYIENTGSYPWGPAELMWLGNTHFLAPYGFYSTETREGNLETGEVIDHPDIDLSDYESSISPDQTRIIRYGTLYDFETQEMIKPVVSTPYDLQSTIWTSDSSQFMDVIGGRDSLSTLTLFDRNGVVISEPITRSSVYLDQFSSDGRYFSFRAGPTVENIYYSYVLDIQSEVIYDLCINDVRYIVWSPDSTQFAFVAEDGQQPIVVVNMDDWQARIVGYHTGSVLKWRSLP